MRNTASLAKGVRVVALGLAGLVGGCASFHDRPLNPVTSARALQERRLDDPRLLRFVRLDLGGPPAAPVRWDLASLTAAAVYERPDMKIAVAQVRVAEGGVRTALEWPNPVLGLDTTYNSTAYTPSPWTVGPIITELLSTAAKRPAAIAEARDVSAAARQQLAVAAWQLRSEVRTALIGVWAARRRLALARRYLSAANEMTSLTEARFQAGMVSAATLTNEKLAKTQAALDLASAERQERLAEAALAAAVGVPGQAIRHADLSFSELDRIEPPAGLHALRQAALIHRPEVLAALARYDAAQQALRLAIAGQYPDLRIGPGYHYDQGDNKYILAISLPVPILNQNQGPIATARANRDLAAARFEQAQTQMLGQIDTAVADWEASRREATSTRQLLTFAQRTVQSDEASFRAGAIGALRLAGSRLARAKTELGALSAEVNERTALGRIEDAFHKPFIKTRKD